MVYSTLNTKIANINQQDFFETTLKTAVTDATDTNIYLNALPTPTEGFLTIEPTGTSTREVIFYNAKGADYVTVPTAAIGRGVSGTAQGHAVSSVVRLADASKYFEFLRDRIIQLNTGWVPADETWVYASASTITVPSGAASKYAVGDKIKLTQTTVKYFYVVAVADTVLTVTGGSDYTVANAAISDNYYSKSVSPVGFPDWFTYTVTRSSSGGNAPTYTLTDVSKFKITGRNCIVKFVWQNNSSGTAGSGTGTLTNSLPVTGVFADTTYAGFETLGAGNIYEAAETIDLFTVNPLSATTVGFLLSTGVVVIGTHQSTTVRRICTTFSYEI